MQARRQYLGTKNSYLGCGKNPYEAFQFFMNSPIKSKLLQTDTRILKKTLKCRGPGEWIKTCGIFM